MKKEVFSLHKSEGLAVQKLGAFELAYYSVPCPIFNDPNEDSMAYFSYDEESLVILVADGAGGHPKGEEASHHVANSIVESLCRFKMTDKLLGFRNAVLDGLESANQQLLDFGSGLKSTASVAEIVDRRLRAYQVGDSGILVCGQKGKVKYKSIFHSLAGYGVESGLIEEEEALEAPDLNEVANMVGDREMSIEIGPFIDLDDRDTVLIASDGVFDNFSIESVTEIIRSGSIEEAGRQMVGFYTERLKTDPKGLKTKYDDFSFIICRLNTNHRG